MKHFSVQVSTMDEETLIRAKAQEADLLAFLDGTTDVPGRTKKDNPSVAYQENNHPDLVNPDSEPDVLHENSLIAILQNPLPIVTEEDSPLIINQEDDGINASLVNERFVRFQIHKMVFPSILPTSPMREFAFRKATM